MIVAFFSEFAGYAYHRAIHMTEAHMSHHEKPNDMSRICGLSVLSALSAVGSSVLIRRTACSAWRAYWCMPMVYWSSITCLHPLLHVCRFEAWPMAYVQRRHDLHHAHGNVNFGPFTPIMDVLFGTEHDWVKPSITNA